MPFMVVVGLDQRRVPGFERWDNGSDNGFPCTSVNCIYVADRDGISKTNSEIMRATSSVGQMLIFLQNRLKITLITRLKAQLIKTQIAKVII